MKDGGLSCTPLNFNQDLYQNDYKQDRIVYGRVINISMLIEKKKTTPHRQTNSIVIKKAFFDSMFTYVLFGASTFTDIDSFISHLPSFKMVVGLITIKYLPIPTN